MTAIKVPPTEIEKADLLAALEVVPAFRDIARRLCFQVDKQKDALEASLKKREELYMVAEVARTLVLTFGPRLTADDAEMAVVFERISSALCDLGVMRERL